ncbi:MAG: TRAP transporter small permease [Burkholderiales bacterium]|nr:TRAP transporter small permease [Burkholderiales bacterium]MDE2394093.1 TRAP transporter small permease [Burkholderiales bacterium]
MDPLRQAAAAAVEERGLLLWCSRALGAVCALTLAFIMLLTFVDVFMRYWFSRPITGSSELVMFAMAVLIFSVFPLVTWREQHIGVGILRGKLEGPALALQRFVVVLVSLAACCGMAAQLLRDGHQLEQEGQRTMVLELPLGALSSFMGAMSAVAALALLLVLVRLIRQAIEPGARRPA